MRCKIRLDTQNDVIKFVNIVEQLDGRVVIKDNEGMCVNARSVIGMLYAMTFNELWCESDGDIYQHIKDFIIE